MIDRSSIMRAVRSRNTTPELSVRRIVTSMGYRYRLHKATLPGRPDLVFASRRKVIFVHGCFWHGHSCSRGSRVPKSNTDYWVGKVGKNQRRDREVLDALRASGWDALVVWECDVKGQADLAARIRAFLDSPHSS